MWYECLALRVTRPGHYSNAQSAARGPVVPLRTLDDVDRALIEALQQNGRDSFRRIAIEVGVSEATIRSRYQRLCEEGTVQVTAVTNPLGLGFDAMAMVGVRTSGPPEDAAEQIAQLDEADYVVVAAGQFDLLVELVCIDRRHLLDVTNTIRAFDSVASTETFVYLELHKQLYDWGIRKTIDESPAAAGTKGG
jgi:Lrp/AsnC family transcriptional regulator for asnA, asnC and gidA